VFKSLITSFTNFRLKKHYKVKHNISSADLKTIEKQEEQIVEEECQTTTEQAEQDVEVQTTEKDIELVH
jgi:hypothetical protein